LKTLFDSRVSAELKQEYMDELLVSASMDWLLAFILLLYKIPFIIYPAIVHYQWSPS
jgi:hypothetical protein